MKAIRDKYDVIERLEAQHFVPYNVIGALVNTENKSYMDETTESVWVENHYFNYVSGRSEVILNMIEAMEAGFYGFSAVHGDLAASIYRNWFLHWYEPTERYVLKGDHLVEESPYPVVKIPIEEAQGIDDRYEYKQEGSLEKIKDAIKNRPSSAIYIDGEIASYVLVHEDNSIGYMYTLEKYRKHGLGYWVSQDIIRQIKAQGIVPFLEINQMNFKSQGLARKLGFEKDAFTPWFGIIKGLPEFFKTWDPLNGESYVFSSIAQMRVVDQVTSDVEKIDFVKVGENFTGKITFGEMHAMFRIELDDSKEAYLLKVDTMQGLSLYDLVSAIAVHFPEHNASFVLPYDRELIGRIHGIIIEK